MTSYCASPATLRLENRDTSGAVLSSLDLMDAAGNFRVSQFELAWPAVREVVAALPTRDGQFDTTRLFGPRVVTITGAVLSTFGTTRQQALNSLAWWTQPALRPSLVYAIDPGNITCRVGLRGAQLSAPYSNPTVSDFTVSWVADDPAAYATTESDTLIFPAIVSTVGRHYDLVHDRVYSQVAPGGFGTCVNRGSYQTWPVFTITGPAVGPAILYQAPATGQIVFVPTYTVPAGATTVIDTRAQTVYYNGDPGASRYDQIDWTQSLWAPLQPGTTTIGFNAAGTTNATNLKIAWHDAYLA